MPVCPKCETEYREGFEVCYDCEVELVESIKRPESLNALEEKFVEDMFATPEESVRFCLNCLVEFAPEAAHCPPCGNHRLETVPAPVYEEVLKRSPLEPHRRIDDEESRSDLKRVFVALSPAEAGFCCATLEGMGVEAFIGSDDIDDMEDDSKIGIWVRGEDVEACSMILPEDPSEWRDDEEVSSGDPYNDCISRANTYFEIKKKRHAIALCTQAIEMDSERPEAFFSLGRIVGSQGNVTHAHESFRAAVERSAEGARGIAAWFFAVFGLMDEDRNPKFTGPKSDEALDVLKAHSKANPRRMEAMRLVLEVCFARGEKKNVAEVRERIERVNRRILSDDSPLRDMKF